MIRQTAAIFLDAYRELNARRLFWIVLVLSGLVVLVFAAVGINERGLTFLWWDLGVGPSVGNGFGQMTRPFFYKTVLFSQLGIRLWLAWIATILALVSTAGIFPDFLASGAIEFTLSKPIGRLRLFLTKYLAGLLFVTLQVGVFCAACFVVLGLRGAGWSPGIFVAVPLVVVFFSYLFGICVLIGVVTRSTIAALLLTVLAWMLIFGLHAAEQTLLTVREFNQARIVAYERDIAAREARQKEAASAEPDGIARGLMEAATRPLREDVLKRRREQLDDMRDTRAWLVPIHRTVLAVKTTLPKTSETIELLQRVLMSRVEIDDTLDRAEESMQNMPLDDSEVPVDSGRVMRRVEEQRRTRSVAWIVGTSLLFEAAVVGLAAWLFWRRDF